MAPPRARRVVIHRHDWPPLQPHTNQGKAYLYGETHTHDAGEQRQPQVEGKLRLIAATRTAVQTGAGAAMHFFLL